MPDNALLTTLKAQSTLLKSSPDSQQLAETITKQLEKAYEKSRYGIEERIAIYEEAIQSGNHYAFQWLLQKAEKHKRLAFKFQYQSLVDYEFEEVVPVGNNRYITIRHKDTGFANLMLSHPDAANTGLAVPQEEKQNISRFRRMIDLVQENVSSNDLKPFLATFSKIAAPSHNFYFFEKLNPDHQGIEFWFFTALIAAVKHGSPALLNHWLSIGRQKSFVSDLTVNDVKHIFTTGLKSHLPELVVHLNDASKALLLNWYVHNVPHTVDAFKELVFMLQLNRDFHHVTLTKAFQHITYCLTLEHVKCFMKALGTQYDNLTVNNLPDCKQYTDKDAMATARQRQDHQAIQHFLHAVQLLNESPFPYRKDESILKALQKLTAEDRTDLLEAVNNKEAYDAHAGHFIQWQLAGTARLPSFYPMTDSSSARTPDTLLTRRSLGLFASHDNLSPDEKIREMCQLMIMTTNPSQPPSDVHEARRYAINQLRQLIAENKNEMVDEEPTQSKQFK